MRTRQLAAAALLLICQNGRAEESSAQLVEKGIRLRRELRDAEALQVFRRADQLNPAPRIRAQIGLAEQALGQWVEAEKDLNEAVFANDDPWITDHIDTLKKGLATIQQHLGTLSIETNASGAELWIRGVRRGPLPVRVAAGLVQLEVRAQGFESARRSVVIVAEQTAKERVDLIPARIRPLAPSTGSGDLRAPAPSTQRIVAWGSLGGAVVLLVGAGAAQWVREKNVLHYNSDADCAATIYQSRDDRCGSFRGTAETAQTFANLGYIGGGALGIASAILFFSSARLDGAKRSGVWIDAPPGGLALGWRGSL